MAFANIVLTFLRERQSPILLCLLGLSLLLLVIVIRLGHGVRRLRRMAVGVVDGETGRFLREELQEIADNLSALSEKLDDLRQQHADLKTQQQSCVQRVGMIRFNAFDDVGGEQSFALALLDADNNGVVFSNLYGRMDSRAYAKPVTEGASEHSLSAEEQEAIRKAAAL
jgi:hypothetical protein